ncbi:tyrosine-type recombinase/integrase [Pseudooceanicola sp.]|uniref:tyrosine-type recombinase/integrase n=1 Tax=Pseudooceanicola sp. TaxID=1914328 RepID=UPI003514BC5E
MQEREPLPSEAVLAVQAECQRLDDELRWLVALVSDTGMRLAEAAGLMLDDLVIDGTYPRVLIQEHPWRRLKTSCSAREVPLVGRALWAARRIRSAESEGVYAFPRFNRTGQTNANSASAALNKWLRPMVPERCTMHSFRHSMRDRLRAVECPADIVDQIGGWQTEGVGQGYGRGYPLDVLAKWMEMLA